MSPSLEFRSSIGLLFFGLFFSGGCLASVDTDTEGEDEVPTPWVVCDVDGACGGGPSDSGGGSGGGTTDAGGGAECAPSPAEEGNRVFVTSTRFGAGLGGLTGADAACQRLADAACLGGTWMAWLGGGAEGPSTRFAQSTEPYWLIGGGVVAENWSDLADGSIAAPINHDETGAEIPTDEDATVWTDVCPGGHPIGDGCSGAEDSVATGLATATDTGWTVRETQYCTLERRLYCFEQGSVGGG